MSNNLIAPGWPVASSTDITKVAPPDRSTESEKLSVLPEWNATEAAYPSAKCIHELFEEQVERTPDAVAVVYQDQQLTYRQLNRRANALAHQLRALGAGPNVLVGICIEPSLEMVVGVLGILKAGSAYLPLDPAFPMERLDFMLEDSQVGIVLMHSSLEPRLAPGRRKHLIPLDRAWDDEDTKSDSNPAGGVQASNLAYVIYTSGSTGKPKGVQVLHRSVVNMLWSMKTEPGLTERDVLLAVTTLSFDIACLELFLPLIVGAKMVIAGWETKRDGAELVAALSQGITVLQCGPITWNFLLQAGWKGTPGLKMMCGGEAMSGELARQLLTRGESLWNLYGPTETTVWSTAQKIEDGDAKISVGRPIANTQVYIVDPEMQPVPVGEVGELLIGGDGVALGYLNRPELTAAKFIDDPFLAGSRVFRTGDCGYFFPDGRICLLGRLDQQIKLRGHRIEPGEIETNIASHPSVGTAVVTAEDNHQGNKILVAYFVLKTESVPTAVELRRHLQARLPDYMIPHVFVPLLKLPLTPNGKIDRQALSLADRPTAASLREPDALLPRNTVELRLARIWEKSIGVPIVDIRDSFFDLGGDSLMATKILMEIETEFGTRLSMTKLLESPTIEQLACTLETSEPAIPWSPLVLLKPGQEKPPWIFIHSFGGNILGFRNLVDCLQLKQPIYALQSVGLDGKEEPLATVEEMAGRYIELIRPIMPATGPIVLVGLSFGGLVAYEMAQQLRAQSRTVELILLDTLGPSYFKPIMQRIVNHLSHFLGLSFREKGQYLLQRVKNLRSRMILAIHRLHPRKSPAGGEAPVAALKKVELVNRVAGQRYHPRSYPGAACLFRATVEQVVGSYEDDHTLGWRELITGGLEVYDMPGHCRMMEEPHVHQLARQLKTYIRRTLGEIEPS